METGSENLTVHHLIALMEMKGFQNCSGQGMHDIILLYSAAATHSNTCIVSSSKCMQIFLDLYTKLFFKDL